MSEESGAVLDRSATDCAVCRRSVLVGEPLAPYRDPRAERMQPVCELCRPRASERGWELAGEPARRTGGTRLRVEVVDAPGHSSSLAASDAPGHLRAVADAPAAERGMLPPQAAILERAIGLETNGPDQQQAASLLERVRRQDAELARLRRELDPARRAEEQRRLERQGIEIRELRTALRERDARIERLQHARHAETSPMRMSGHALDAFNQSAELERMARIARTLGDPVVNVHDEGAGIPRRVRLTLAWDIAWYEFVVKLDLGAGRASVHETGTGGDPTILPLERRRANARWSGSGLKLS
jgi:hypothetical protein